MTTAGNALDAIAFLGGNGSDPRTGRIMDDSGLRHYRMRATDNTLYDYLEPMVPPCTPLWRLGCLVALGIECCT